MRGFLESKVARRVVIAKDAPGFIANRFGMWSLFQAVRTAEKLHLPVEEVDAITGPFLGRPKSGTFRLIDLIGLDVARDISSSLLEKLPEDPNIRTLDLTASMYSLLARGWLGDKTGHGYYRKEGRETFALDLGTLAYRTFREPTLPGLSELAPLPLGERIRSALELRSEVGEFLREYLLPTLRYADLVKEQVSHSVEDFDRVMQWGFGWELGPFGIIEALGRKSSGIAGGKSFYLPGRYLGFDGEYKKSDTDASYERLNDFPVIDRSENLLIRSLGGDVSAVSINTKMGVITPSLVAELNDRLTDAKLDPFVLTSESRSFSAGYDLNAFAAAILADDLSAIDRSLADLQRLGELLESRRCVAAVFGHCLGAGLELALSCSKVLAAAETQIGLPESRVGVIPGGRGTTLVRLNNSFNARRLADAAITLTLGTVASNADLARQHGYLRPGDITVYSPDRLISIAREAAINAKPTVRPPWTAEVGPLAGMIDRALDELAAKGTLTEYDQLIGGKIRQIFSRATGYQDALQRERAEFVDLCSKALTRARIRHMLESKKPLRN
jgi:3-hydroxyacyl-CoA dehydrogenase